MSVSKISWTTKLERTTDIRFLEFADQLYLYERRQITKPVDLSDPEMPGVTFIQGVADWSSIESVKLGRLDDVGPFDPTFGKKPGSDYVPMMISDRGLETIRVEGHPFIRYEVLEKLSKSGDLVRKGQSQSFIDLFERGFSAKNVFFASVKDSSIVDLRGKPIVMPTTFSSMDGLHSENYDLDQILEILEKNPEIEVFKDSYGQKKVFVPTYGDPDEPTRYGLSLIWRPTRGTWDKLLSNLAEKGIETKFVHLRAYDLLKNYDVLGIASAERRADLDEELEDDTPGLTI